MLRVVDAGVDDLAVARADTGADRLSRFEDEDFTTARGERRATSQADDSATDDDSIDPVHVSSAMGDADAPASTATLRLLRHRRAEETCCHHG